MAASGDLLDGFAADLLAVQMVDLGRMVQLARGLDLQRVSQPLMHCHCLWGELHRHLGLDPASMVNRQQKLNAGWLHERYLLTT